MSASSESEKERRLSASSTEEEEPASSWRNVSACERGFLMSEVPL